MADRPETSTVREALAVVSAADDLLVGPPPEERRVAAVETLLRSGRELRPHQVEDVIDHVRARYGPTPEPETTDA